MFDLQLVFRCGSKHNYVSRSVTEMNLTWCWGAKQIHNKLLPVVVSHSYLDNESRTQNSHFICEQTANVKSS